MKSMYNQTHADLEKYFLENNAKKYKATQIFEWLYQKKINDFDEITNLKKEVILKLKKEFTIDKLEIIKKQEDDYVVKYLFKLKDDNNIEAVLMKHDYGNSLCISSQIGCNMGCTFCESGKIKKIRDLEPSEMVLQLLEAEKDLNLRISHVVIMGIGEPFDNFDNVMKFIDIINHPKGLSIGARHITVSTIGIIPKIKDFMNYDKQVNLAISLNAPNNELRNKLMPINKVYNLEELIKVLKEYIIKTNRRITFEYVLLNNINDSLENAIELCNLLKGMNCYVNLIPYNKTSSNYEKSKKQINFYDTLKKNKINVTIRREFGKKINAACGQLSIKEK